MSDDLRTRIADTLRHHTDRALTNYDTGREECRCGEQGSQSWEDHLVDVLLVVLLDTGEQQ